jgi:CDP-glucose 4,6-dehydratase
MEVSSLKHIFQGKKVLITGHTGFKGSWLLKVMHLLGAEIKGYALEPLTVNDIYHLIDGDSLCDSVIHDVKDAGRIKKEILEFQPDFIFHLAAQPLVRLSYDIPLETYAVNSQGTANVLDCLRFLEKKCVAVMITTDKVYANMESGRYYAEDDKLGGYDPYSASKACAELIIDSYRNSFFNITKFNDHQKSISVARAGNVIGGGDWSKDRIIPDIVRALEVNQPIKVRNPNSVRPWQHVLEPVVGYIMLAAKQWEEPTRYSGAYNFGPVENDTLPVSRLVEMAIDQWGSGSFEHFKEAQQTHEASLLHLDINKAKRELSWKPEMQAADAIHATIDWYKAFFKSRISIKEFTEKQINDYLNKLS